MAFVHESFVSFKTVSSVKHSLTSTALILADAMQSLPVQHERLVPSKPFFHSPDMSQHVLCESRGKRVFSKEYDVPWSIEGFGCRVEISDHD